MLIKSRLRVPKFRYELMNILKLKRVYPLGMLLNVITTFRRNDCYYFKINKLSPDAANWF